MSNCVNFNSPDVVKLAGELNVSPAVAAAKIGLYQEKNGLDKFPTVEDIVQSNEVNTTLKAVDILQSDKAKQIFEKGNKAKWSLEKILTELQVPKEQKQMLLDLGITDREQLALQLASNYSYTVEINPTKEKNEDRFTLDGVEYFGNEIDNDYRKGLYGDLITREEYDNAKKEYFKNNKQLGTTSYYSNLTVPGGTNYTENEIATPLITPSIKGHAQFSTDKGIGWFRSDDKSNGFSVDSFIDNYGHTWSKENNIWYDFDPIDESKTARIDLDDSAMEDIKGGEILTDSKTRRILEIQSDLFQKGRDKITLTKKGRGVEDFAGYGYQIDDLYYKYASGMSEKEKYSVTNVKTDIIKYITKEEFETKRFEGIDIKDTENQFLQLLNKDNNWVTFFVKSIIQDSAKKGYEKVLFPSGNTASKVEGHTTLEEFKKQKEDRIKTLEQDKIGIDVNEEYEENVFGEQKLKNIDKEIAQLKQELERVEGPEGFGALKPIYNFYENTVTNILNKTYGKNNVNQITDEYGNTWNEITLDKKRDTSIILLKRIDYSNIVDDSQEEMFNFNQDVEFDKESDNTDKNLNLLFTSKKIEDKTDEYTVDEVISNIQKDSELEFTENGAFYLQKLKQLIKKSGAKVHIISDEAFNAKDKDAKDASMLYSATSNTIFASKEKLAELSLEQVVQSFIHEVSHSTSITAYRNGKAVDKNGKRTGTFEEQAFANFIDEAFQQYKDLANLKNDDGKYLYGYTSAEEFIAEIYSNPKFQAELRKNEGFWNRFINELRRIVGLAKSLVNNKLIDSSLLIKTIEDMVESDQSSFKGTMITSIETDVLFKKQEDLKRRKINTLSDKLEELYDKSLDNIDQMLLRAKAKVKKTGKDNKIYIDKLKDLSDSLRKGGQLNKWKALNDYSDFMQEQIDFALSKIQGNPSKLKTLDAINNYENYVMASNLIEPMLKLVEDSDILDLPEDLQKIAEEISEKVSDVAGNFKRLSAKFRAAEKKILKQELSNPRYTQEVISQMEKELESEYPKDSLLSKKEWVSQQLLGDKKEELDKRVSEYVNNLFKGTGQDISNLDKTFFSSLKTSSRFIQFVQKLITSMKSKIDSAIRDNDFKLDDLFKRFTDKMGNTNPSEMFKNILEFGSDGTPYIKSEYTMEFLDLYNNEYIKLKKELKAYRRSLAEDFVDTEEIDIDLKVIEYNKQLRDWRAKHLMSGVDSKNSLYPKTKYLNKFDKLSDIEKEFLSEWKKLVNTSTDITHGKKELAVNAFNAKYYTLPSVSINKMERIIEGKVNIVDTAKQTWSDVVDFRPEDEDSQNFQKRFDVTGAEVRTIPILYRNKINPKEQSLDLFTLMRMEFANQTNFKLKSENELTLNALVNVVEDKQYNKVIPGTTKLVSNIFGIRVKDVQYSGKESNEAKRLRNIVDQHLYNVFHTEGFKIAGKDVNKIVGSVNGYTSWLGMTLNYFTAPTNIANAEFQMLIQKIAGNLDSNALSQAHAKYISDLPNIVKDSYSPVKKSFVNQLNLLTDVFGGLTHNQNEFIKNTFLKSLSTEQLRIMQEGGEHMVQSVLNMALLKSIKVRNEQGEYVDIKGKKTTSDKAASLYDMVEQDKTTKQINFNDKFTYTDVSTVVKFKEGGFENVRLYIKNKISDTMGEYDSNFKNDFQRTWYGALFSMYKKFFISAGITRFRGGITSIMTPKEMLSYEDLHWNEADQQYEEGYYVTFGRLLMSGQYHDIQGFFTNLQFIASRWNQLSEYEKGNVRKAVLEFGTIIMLNMVIIPLAMGLAGGGDDDELLFLALMARRMEQELSQFSNPVDLYKITKNPIAALNTVQDVLSAGKFAINPFIWGSENKKGESRFIKALEKVTIPSALRPDRTAKNLLDYQNSLLVTPYSDSWMYKLVE